MKNALIASHAREGGEQQALLSRYAPALANANFFTSLHANTWAPLVSVAIALFSLIRLLGPIPALAGVALQVGVTAATFRVRASFRRFDRRSNSVAVERVGLLRESLKQALSLRLAGWASWQRARLSAVRAREVTVLARAQLIRVFVDVGFAVAPTLVLVVAFLT
jgi:ABC-type multidrug transport system fused ATPase/permease subunit